MAVMNVNPTRMQLTRLKKQLSTAVRGHKLLKDKRDELMRQFLDLVKETKELRIKVEKGLSDANNRFVLAAAAMDRKAMDAALLAPKQEIYLSVKPKNVMSVNIPEFETTTRTDSEGDIFPYGFAFTGFELDDAVEGLSRLTNELIMLARNEKSLQLMASEIEKTRRRVNALEHVMIPRYRETIKYISMKLEENDRSSRARLMKVKDMMLEKAHNYSKN